MKLLYILFISQLVSVFPFDYVIKTKAELFNRKTVLDYPGVNTLGEAGVNQKSVYLKDFLPFNFVKDASEDYSLIIQNVVSRNRNIIFPNFPLLINDKGISIPSNTTITFLTGSELRLKPSSKPGYNILHIRGVSNVTLYNPVIIGDRYTHLKPTGGEWGMGIGIYGSNNISIVAPKISNCWGDGIYIGTENGENCKNVSIKQAVIKYNRRNGISVIGVERLRLEDSYSAFNNGVLPMSGIDIEPNSPSNEIKDVIIKNLRTEQNPGSGVQIDLGNLMGGGQKKVEITVINHSDVKSKVGMIAMSRVSDGHSTLRGNINVINPSWSQNIDKALFTILYGANDVRLTIANPMIRKYDNNKQLSKAETLKHLKTLLNPKARDHTTIAF